MKYLLLQKKCIQHMYGLRIIIVYNLQPWQDIELQGRSALLPPLSLGNAGWTAVLTPGVLVSLLFLVALSHTQV